METKPDEGGPEKRYDLLTIAIALIAGLLAIWAGNRYFGAQIKSAEEPEIQILAAARDLAAGEQIAEDAVVVVPYPARAVTGDMARPQDRVVLVDLPLRVAVRKGNPILRSYVSGAPIDARLSMLLQEGDRAITIAVDPVSGLAGHLRPNDRVDVLGTFQVPSADPARALRTRTLLVNVPVLAVGERTGTSFADQRLPGLALLSSQTRSRAQATTVTLRVTPEQGEILAFASESARLKLLLRHPDDASPRSEPVDHTLGELFDLPERTASDAPPARPPRSPVTYER